MTLTKRVIGAVVAGVLAVPLSFPTHAVAAEPDRVVVHPQEYTGAIKNPLTGLAEKDFFVNTTDPAGAEDQPLDYMPWATTLMTYIPWDHLENDEDDSIEKISQYLDQRWRAKDSNGVWRPYEDYNIKVIPRVYLRFPAETSGNTGGFYGLGGDHWPDDISAGDFTSAKFDTRLKRMIERLAQLWDDDPRVAYVQMGIFGTWGEQHGTAQPANIEKYFQEYFTKKHVQVRYHDKGQWERPNDFGHYNDSIGNRNTAGNWATKPVGGEPSYDYVGENVHGKLVRETYLDDEYTNNTTNLIRSTHSVYLTWAGDYSYGSRWTAADAEGGREAYLANKAKIDANAEKLQKELGYRYVMSEFDYPERIEPGQSFDVSFKVKNTGSAPMYYNWPVQVSLRDPASKKIVWSDTFKNVDITKWQPGSGYPAFDNKKSGSWSKSVLDYTTAPQEHTETGTFTLPSSVKKGTKYEIQLAVLDPGGNVPSLRFAMQNYRSGGYHPMGVIGVGKNPSKTAIDPETFDNPAVDVGLRYYRAGEQVSASPAKLKTLKATGTVRLALGGAGYDLENLVLTGTDTEGKAHVLDAATVSWRVSAGKKKATLNGSVLQPLDTGKGKVEATFNGVTSDSVNFEVSDEVGALSGTVKDQDGEPLAGVKLALTSGSTTLNQTTAADGKFAFTDVFAGTYTLTAAKSAYRDTTVSSVQITKGADLTQDLSLELATAGDFSDDFSAGAANWTAGTGSWAVANGKYTQSTIGGSNSWRYGSTITGKIWDDATYDVDIEYGGQGANWGAFLFRKPSQADTVNTGGYFVDWQHSGKIELNRAASSIVNLATVQRTTDWTVPHHLRVVTKGSSIKVYVDNEEAPIIDVTDATHSHGYVGVGANGSKWSFDNVTVTEQ